MSLQEEELEKHAENILKSRRIKGKIVILCEGDINYVKNNPSAYGKLEQMPDANFYKRCLPQKMRSQKAPQFFNCGSRDDVINTYFKLQELHKKDPSNSYLTIDLLFAIIDLDIQVKTIDNYQFSDTEKIFFDLYTNLKINHNKLPNHRIFITGLIHKEAYFLLPELQTLFNNYNNDLRYNGSSLNLTKIYKDIINDFEKDKDLKNNFHNVKKRLAFSHLNTSNISDLKASFMNEINNSYNSDLIRMLFLIRKAKPYWRKINTTDNISDTRLREQLSLEIAKFYSEKNDNNFDLTAIFNHL